MKFDMSEMTALASDLGDAPRKAAPRVAAVVSKGALNVKKQMQQDAAASQYFKKLGPTINYDIKISDDGIEAEIGPNKESGGAASFAGIAYFGSSRPGGATVPDPFLALDEESPRFFEEIAKIAGFIF